MFNLNYKKNFIYREAKREGRMEAKRETAQAMLREGISTEVICRITKFKPAEVAALDILPAEFSHP